MSTAVQHHLVEGSQGRTVAITDPETGTTIHVRLRTDGRVAVKTTDTQLAISRAWGNEVVLDVVPIRIDTD